MCRHAHLVKLAAQPILVEPDRDPFARYIVGADEDMRDLADSLKAGDITLSQWYEKFTAAILDGHTASHAIGQSMAGTTPDLGAAAIRGQMMMDIESEYMQGFLFDLQGGRYGDIGADDFAAESVYYRERMYLGKMRGTAGYGFVDGSDAAAEFEWVLGGIEEHCLDCPVLAEGGPYTKSTLYATPGSGDTPCLGYCKCHLQRDDGAESPYSIF